MLTNESILMAIDLATGVAIEFTTNAFTVLPRIAQAVDKARFAVDTLTTSLTKGATAFDAYGTSAARATDPLTGFGNAAKAAGSAAGSAGKSANAGASGVRDFGASASSSAAQVDTLTGSIVAMNRAMAGARVTSGASIATVGAAGASIASQVGQSYGARIVPPLALGSATAAFSAGPSPMALPGSASGSMRVVGPGTAAAMPFAAATRAFAGGGGMGFGGGGFGGGSNGGSGSTIPPIGMGGLPHFAMHAAKLGSEIAVATATGQPWSS